MYILPFENRIRTDGCSKSCTFSEASMASFAFYFKDSLRYAISTILKIIINIFLKENMVESSSAYHKHNSQDHFEEN